MLCRVYCACCSGIEAITVTVEVDVCRGIKFYLVGLPDSAVKESQQRISSALEKYGFRIPGKKIIINMAPANIRKEGSAFDATIAIGILAASEQLENCRLEDFFIMGELALDGTLRPIQGALPIIIHAAKEHFKACILPRASAMEGAEIEGITIFAADTFGDIIEILRSPDTAADKVVKISGTENLSGTKKWDYDFADVKGQQVAKRGLEIAAAGGHNVLMIGSPGCGKTFMAKCLPSILPPMSKEESIETSTIYSVADILDASSGLMRERPFRAPHHTITLPALVGGGRNGMPGEISLAHNGVLFADEFAEFSRQAIDVLRQPLEDGVIQISRVKTKYLYPARFMFVASMNPCPCGYIYDSPQKCTCSSSAISKYRSRISGPVYDRIDINLKVRQVKAGELVGCGTANSSSEPSSRIAERVRAAREIQQRRYVGETFFANAQIPPSKLSCYCSMGREEQLFLRKIITALCISARGCSRIIKIARTIADLSGRENINAEDLSCAAQLRSTDKME